jgi:type VII secretion protein EccB
MASRRDQLQSYQFLTQRVISAFVMRETDPAQSPLRRGIGAIFGGIMVAVIVGAGFGVYGILTKVGSTNWKADGAVVIEKETGASFVYLSGRLYPTLNYASALLASGKGTSQTFRVAHNSLREVPRGLTIGISGAPNSLPAAGSAVGLPWTLCSSAGADGSGGTTTTVSLVLGSAPTGARPVGDGQGLLVKDAVSGTSYLVSQHHRHALREAKIVIPALFGAVVTPATAGTAWINSLPAGVPIGPISIDGRGTPSKSVPGRKVGDVLVAQTGSGPQYYLVFDDGLAPVTELQKDIIDAQFPAEPAQVSVSEATSARRSGRLTSQGDEFAAPLTPPKLDAQPATPDGLLCAATTDPRAAPDISTGGTVRGIDTAIPTAGRSSAGASLADGIVVPAGSVAVIRVLPSVGATGGAYALVTDLGVRYAVPSAGVLQALGYRPEQAIDIPASLASRIPAGPVLDPAAATVPVSAGGPAAQSPNPAPS